MLLSADIGGTKTHLALIQEDGLQIVKEMKFLNRDFASFIDILIAFDPPKIHKVALAIAGPIIGSVVSLTNIPWKIDKEEIKERLHVEDVQFLNDLEAFGYGLFFLSDKDFMIVQKGEEKKRENRAVLTVGTGLGEAGVIWSGEKYVISKSEGGHIDFAPQSKEQEALYAYLNKKYGHVSYERVLSGKGLIDLYQYFLGKELSITPEEILQERESPTGKKTVELFLEIFGAQAGNTALHFFALSGIFLGGSIAVALAQELKKNRFLDAFIQKGRMESLLMTVPIKVILSEKAALLGAAFSLQTRNQTANVS